MLHYPHQNLHVTCVFFSHHESVHYALQTMSIRVLWYERYLSTYSFSIRDVVLAEKTDQCTLLSCKDPQ